MSEEPIKFTDSAAAKVRELIAEEGNTDLKLRVYITGGGCSGFQYDSPSTKRLTKTIRKS